MRDTSVLTRKQRQIYEFIRNKIEKQGIPPTIRDIGDQFSIASPNGVMCHLKALQKKGFIQRTDKQARSITLEGVRVGGATIPLLGKVAAGKPLEAVPETERISLNEMFCGQDHFALVVRGDSMIEDHIMDGDTVIIRKQETADNGTRVVAQINNEVTLKKFFKKRDVIRLEPSNGKMEAIIVEADADIQILGVLVGVLRQVK